VEMKVLTALAIVLVILGEHMSLFQSCSAKKNGLLKETWVHFITLLFLSSVTPGDGVTSQNAMERGGNPDYVRSAHDVVQVISSASRRLHESDGQKVKSQKEDDGWDEGGGGGASGKAGGASASGKKQERPSEGSAPQPARVREAPSSSQKKLPQQPVDMRDTQPSKKQLEEEQPEKLPSYLPKPGTGSDPDSSESRPGKTSQVTEASGSPPMQTSSSGDTQKISWPAQQPQWSSKQQNAGACVMKADEAKCSGRGVCMQNGDCQCLQGYAGQYCEIQCPRANGQPVGHATMPALENECKHIMRLYEMYVMSIYASFFLVWLDWQLCVCVCECVVVHNIYAYLTRRQHLILYFS
jgi:hypothetical protein